MTSAEQADANRRNAENSTGPRTVAGKARSSRNALKHGLSARKVVMLGEDPAEFETLRDAFYAHYHPADPVAENLVEQVAASVWRLRRVPEIEAGIFESCYFNRQAERARQQLFSISELADEREATERGDEPRPVLGDVFERAQRSLNSLIRIAGAIEGSMYRAMRELERIKSQQEVTEADSTIIDLEPDDDAHPDELSGPRPVEP